MLKSLRNSLFAGIFLTLPIVVTIWLILWLIRTVGSPLAGLLFLPFKDYVDASLMQSAIGVGLMNLISTIVVLIFLTIVGFCSQFFLGRVTISFFENLMAKIPLASSIYRTVKQIVDTFSKKKKNVFQKAVMIEFPREGVYSVGFLTGNTSGEVGDILKGEYLNVFVPTTPNPTSGFLMLLKKEDVIELEMSVADAMKFIVSFGAVVSAKDANEAKAIAQAVAKKESE